MLIPNKDYIGVSLTEEALKAVFFKVQGSAAKVTQVIKTDLRGVPETDLPRTIQTSFASLNIKKPQQAFCIIPANQVITKNIEIPSLDAEEIRSIIDLQAGRHTPYSREEILVGYITIGVFQRNYTKVLLIIVNRDVIKKQLTFFEEAGVKIEKTIFVPEGIARFYGKALNVKAEDTPVGIIDIDQPATYFTVEFNNTVATCRSIPVGISHIQKEGPGATARLLEEISKSIELYQNEDINKLPEIYIIPCAHIFTADLQAALQEKVKATVKVMPFAEIASVDPSVKKKLETEYVNDSFSDLVTCGLTVHEAAVDLTPEEVKVQRALEEKSRELIRAGILGIVLLILICGIFLSKIYFRKIYRDKLADEFAGKHKEVVVLDRVAHKTRIIKDYLSSRMTALDIIYELYAIVPKEIYLEEVFVDEDGAINIRGVSESMSRVFNFITALEESALFKGVKTKSTSAKKDRGKDVAAFEIAFRLEGSKEALPKEETEDEAEVAVEEKKE